MEIESPDVEMLHVTRLRQNTGLFGHPLETVHRKVY